MFFKIGVLKMFTIFIATPVLESLLIKLQAWRSTALITSDSKTGVFL